MRGCLAIALLSACYDAPVFRHCEVACTLADMACPDPLVCDTNNGVTACRAPDRQACEGIAADASPNPCYGHAAPPFVLVCPAQPPPETRPLPTTFDTSGTCDFTIGQVGGPPLCGIIARNIVIDFKLRVIGDNPLLLLATERLQITSSGEIDVASHGGIGASTGLAASANRKTSGVGATSDVTNSGAAGGAGGTMRGAGGQGGDSSLSLITGGQPSGAGNLSIVQGGGAGGHGGDHFEVLGGNGGSSGGAVYLLATTLEIAGTINASGAFGGGGGTLANSGGSGGGGGGSGGMIVLEATTFDVAPTAKIFALGGGGGGGGNNQVAGLDGTDPVSPTSGGIGGGNGGNGGTVSNGVNGNRGVQSNGSAGGGGGGAAGMIRTHPPTFVFPSNTVSPTPNT